MTGKTSNLPSACTRYAYFMTSANKKLSSLSYFEPPPAVFTLLTAAKPEPVRQVALIALKLFHTQSRYYIWVSMFGTSVERKMAHDFIPRDAVGVVETLDHFRAQVICAVGDVESGLLVELFLVGWYFLWVPAP